MKDVDNQANLSAYNSTHRCYFNPYHFWLLLNQYFFELSVFNIDKASCVIGKKISALNPWKITGLSYNEGLTGGFVASVSVVLIDLFQNINKIFYLIFYIVST